MIKMLREMNKNRYKALQLLADNLRTPSKDLSLSGIFNDVKDEVKQHDDGSYIVERKLGRDYNNVVKNATTWQIANSNATTHQFYKDLSSELGYARADSGSPANAKLKIGNKIFPVLEQITSDLADFDSFNINSNSVGIYAKLPGQSNYTGILKYKVY